MSDTTVEELYAAPPGAPLPLDDQRLLWRAQRGTRAEMLDLREANVLRCCDALRPLAGHVAAATRQTGWPANGVEPIVRRLAERGLLLRLDQFLPDPARAPTPERCPPPLLAIRTCARPDGLRRLLDSLEDVERRFDSSHRCVVIDDAVDAEASASTREVAREFAQSSRSDVRYLGPAERPAILARFDDGADLLDPRQRSVPTGARGWNWAVLLSAGAALGILDDDFAFPLRVPTDARWRWSLLNSLEADTEFFDSQAEIERLAPIEGEPYARLRDIVGASPAALFRRDGIRRDSVRELPAGSLAHLRDEARVVAAFSGVYGHLAFDSSVFMNLAHERTLTSLFRAPYRPERLRADRIWHGTREARIVASAVFTPLLIDNRELLPFTGTHGKADDTLFINLLRAIEPDAVFAALPLAIGHDADPARDRIARSLEPAITDLDAILAYALNGAQPPVRAASRADRLSAIGLAFDALARAGDDTLDQIVVRHRDETLALVVRALGDSRRRFAARAPQAWLEHVGRIIAVNEAALARRDVAPELRSRFRTAAGQLARGSRVWASWWDSARDGRLLDALPPP